MVLSYRIDSIMIIVCGGNGGRFGVIRTILLGDMVMGLNNVIATAPPRKATSR